MCIRDRAKDVIKAERERNEQIEIMPIVLEELSKFSTDRYKIQLENAYKTFALGELVKYENISEEMASAKALPHKKKEEKQIRSDAINLVRSKKTSVKLIDKYGIENIIYPSDEEKQKIENRDTKSMIETIKAKNELKALTKKRSVYDRVTAPYHNAKWLIVQAENYSHLDKIEMLYRNLVTHEQIKF